MNQTMLTTEYNKQTKKPQEKQFEQKQCFRNKKIKA